MARPAPFDYAAPTDLSDAVKLLRGPGMNVLLAGGQSLLPAVNRRAVRPDLLVDLGGIAELRGCSLAGGVLRVGAMTTLREMELDERVCRSAPALALAVAMVGDPAIRRRATVGGSVAYNGLGAEIPVACLLHGAEIELIGAHGRRRLPSAAFLGETRRVRLPGDEIVTAIRISVGRDTFAMREYSALRHGVNTVAAVRIGAGPTGDRFDVTAVTGGNHAPRSHRIAIERSGCLPWSADAVADSVAERVCADHSSSDHAGMSAGVARSAAADAWERICRKET